MILPPTAYIAAGALAAGLCLGGWAAHAWYAPKLELAESRVDALSTALDTQNTAVAKLEADGKASAKRAAAALAAAEAGRREAERAAMDIMTLQPPPGADRCTAASDLIRQELAK